LALKAFGAEAPRTGAAEHGAPPRPAGGAGRRPGVLITHPPPRTHGEQRQVHMRHWHAVAEAQKQLRRGGAALHKSLSLSSNMPLLSTQLETLSCRIKTGTQFLVHAFVVPGGPLGGPGGYFWFPFRSPGSLWSPYGTGHLNEATKTHTQTNKQTNNSASKATNSCARALFCQQYVSVRRSRPALSATANAVGQAGAAVLDWLLLRSL